MASAIAHTTRARHGRGTFSSRSRMMRLRSSWVAAMRRDWRPGKPSRAATSRPLSSPREGLGFQRGVGGIAVAMLGYARLTALQLTRGGREQLAELAQLTQVAGR